MASRFLLLCFVACYSTLQARAQGTFQNLDFEAVDIQPPDASGFFPFAQVFPGWTGYVGTNEASQAFYNGVSIGGALNSVIGPFAPEYYYAGLSGYTAALAAGFDGVSGHRSVAIAQSGLVPVTAQSLRFSIGSASYPDVSVELLLTFDGQSVPFFPLSFGANYTVYGGDISAFAGLPAELRFTERPISSLFSKVYLDDIEFSDIPIPEPSGASLLLLGSLLVAGRRIRERLGR